MVTKVQAGVVVAAVLGSSPVLAEVAPFASAGVTLGGSFRSDGDDTFFVGGEVSGGAIVDLKREPADTDRWAWVGGYVDLVRDVGTDSTRLSIGPELGYKYLALDGGIVRAFGDAPAWGFAIRPAITIGFVALFARYTRIGADGGSESDLQVGLLLKFPYTPGMFKWGSL